MLYADILLTIGVLTIFYATFFTDDIITPLIGIISLAAALLLTFTHIIVS